MQSKSGQHINAFMTMSFVTVCHEIIWIYGLNHCHLCAPTMHAELLPEVISTLHKGLEQVTFKAN